MRTYMNRTDIGARVKAARKKADMAQVVLAAKVSRITGEDVPRTTCSQWEGIVDIHLSKFLAVCEALRMTPDELLYGKEQVMDEGKRAAILDHVRAIETICDL